MPSPEHVERLRLPQAINEVLGECRMVLPGIQALFGFQLVAVTEPVFSKLPDGLKRLHLVATVLTTIAIALVLATPAYHRQVLPRAVSGELLRISTRLLVASLWTLAVSICLDLYLVAWVIVEKSWVVVIAIAVFAIFIAFWVVFPSASRHMSRARSH